MSCHPDPEQQNCLGCPENCLGFPKWFFDSIQSKKSIFFQAFFGVGQQHKDTLYVHCAHSSKVTAPTDENSGNESKIRTTSKQKLKKTCEFKQFSGHPPTIVVQDPADNSYIKERNNPLPLLNIYCLSFQYKNPSSFDSCMLTFYFQFFLWS